MRISIIKFFCLLLLSSAAFGQRFWEPLNVPLAGNRYNDIVFVSANIGYATNFDSIIIKTIDGGQTWQTINKPRGKAFRALCFLDSLTGFVGKLQVSNAGASDTVICFRTTDGGQTWSELNLPGPRPFGICGMSRVNDSTAVAVGRYNGSSRFYRTVNRGITWTYKDLSNVANGGMVDVHFFSPDTGIAVGSAGNYSSGAFDSSAVVLYTSDGGNNWAVVKRTNNGRELAWKISFPSRQTGYVSIQQTLGTTRTFLKTGDGGLTWQELPYVTMNAYSAQGIGFLNDTLGWIGGKCCGGDPSVFRTEDGGISWVKDTIGEGVNRIRFYNGTGYAAAYNKIFKYPRVTPISSSTRMDKLPGFKVIRKESNLHIQIPERYLKKDLEIVLFDMSGRFAVQAKADGPETIINTGHLHAGVYLLSILEYGHLIYSERVIEIR